MNKDTVGFNKNKTTTVCNIDPSKENLVINLKTLSRFKDNIPNNSNMNLEIDNNKNLKTTINFSFSNNFFKKLNLKTEPKIEFNSLKFYLFILDPPKI